MEHAWKQSLEILRNRVDEGDYESLIRRLRPVATKDRNLLVEAPNKHAVEVISDRYLPLIEEILSHTAGAPVRVLLQAPTALQQELFPLAIRAPDRTPATPREAMFSGYRPCKRWRPMDTDGRPPGWVGRLLDQLEADPGTRIRAAHLRSAGVDPARVRRYFMKHYGMTFQAYARARRLGDAFRLIKEGATVSDVAIQSGFESESGFRTAFERAFGTAPAEAVRKDAVVLEWIPSPVGPLVAGASSAGICLLEFSDRRMLEKQLETLRRRFDAPVVPGRSPWLDKLRKQLEEYFRGERRDFDLPLDIRGTPFQEKVWRALLTLPYGETWSYRDVAVRVGVANATRAVGTANGMNRIAIVCQESDGAGGGRGRGNEGWWRTAGRARGSGGIGPARAGSGSSIGGGAGRSASPKCDGLSWPRSDPTGIVEPAAPVAPL